MYKRLKSKKVHCLLRHYLESATEVKRSWKCPEEALALPQAPPEQTCGDGMWSAQLPVELRPIREKRTLHMP